MTEPILTLTEDGIVRSVPSDPEILNPFFTALGWDMDNRQGLSETFKQVIHEESIKVAGASKAPDYTLSL